MSGNRLLETAEIWEVMADRVGGEGKRTKGSTGDGARPNMTEIKLDRLIEDMRLLRRQMIEEILAGGAERAEITVEQVLRELAVLGFSDIGKVVRWRPEPSTRRLEDADNPDQPAREVLQSRVLVIDSATPPEARLAVAKVRPRTVCA
jgi:hypothetical protein